MYLKCILIFFCLLQLCLIKAELSPIVSTSLGRVQGLVRESENGTRVYFYQGIRYAQAARFKRPLKANAWPDIYKANRVRFGCPQQDLPILNSTGDFESDNSTEAQYSSEDCLFLNVWTPASALDANLKLPVMFWIHGGGFKAGNIFLDLYDGRHLSALGNVVVVSINYRLGPLGWLSDGDFGEASGNLGLYDMHSGLTWVHENVAFFGGDPNLVTIFGESAGSMAVSALLLDKFPKGQYQRAIMQSGGSNQIAPKRNIVAATHDLAASVGCESSGDSSSRLSASVLECLRNKPAQDLNAYDGYFCPLFGDRLLPSPPLWLAKMSTLQVDLLLGANQDEGVMFVHNAPNITTVAAAKVFLSFIFDSFLGAEIGHVYDYYLGNLTENATEGEIKKVMAQVFTDGFFNCPMAMFGEDMAGARLHGSPKRHFAYQLRQPVDMPLVGCVKADGVCHGDDLIFLFGHPISRPTDYTDADYRLSKEMIHQWGHFARTGLMDKVEGRVEWSEAYHVEQKGVVDVMELIDGQYRMRPYHFEEQCHIWKGVLFRTGP